jgi:hypothetical protein
MSKSETPSKITPEDLEGKLRAFQGGVQAKVESKRNTLVMAGAAGVTVLLIIFFLMGKRSGKKKTTLVEIRRI